MTAYGPTLRQRLTALRNHPEQSPHPGIPATGEINAESVAEIQQLAGEAKAGDITARDRLYSSLWPRLHRVGYVLRPWPNTPESIGLWDRDDVDQEGWLIFTELLAAWDGDTPFVTYLLARYAWRLRDRILRGIGRRLAPIGMHRVPDDILAVILAARDSDQPESAVLATKLLEHVLEQRLGHDSSAAVEGEILTALRSPLRPGEKVPTSLPDDGHPFSQIEVA